MYIYICISPLLFSNTHIPKVSKSSTAWNQPKNLLRPLKARQRRPSFFRTCRNWHQMFAAFLRHSKGGFPLPTFRTSCWMWFGFHGSWARGIIYVWHRMTHGLWPPTISFSRLISRSLTGWPLTRYSSAKLDGIEGVPVGEKPQHCCFPFLGFKKHIFSRWLISKISTFFLI